MVKKMYFWNILIIVLLFSCASTGSSSSRQNYTGHGGKGTSIAILVPKSVGLETNQRYIPELVQGEIVSNFSGYSAISVLDRVRLEDQYAELFSGFYDDSAQGVYDLGHLPPTTYIMTGNISRTGAGFNLQIQITKTSDKMTVASYSGICSLSDMENLTGIRRASLDLLQKMDVALTSKATAELGRAATRERASGQTALAKGITAQRSGTVVEAMSYFYEASRFDPTLKEAVTRLSNASSNVRTGNIGNDARRRIAERDEWISILKQSEDYYRNHLPIEIEYTPKLNQTKLNYQDRTVDLQFNIRIYQSENMKIMRDVLSGLKKTGKIKEWGFKNWPFSEEYNSGFYLSGTYVGDHWLAKTTRLMINGPGLFSEEAMKMRSSRIIIDNNGPIIRYDEPLGNGLITNFNTGYQGDTRYWKLQTLMVFALVNDKGKTISQVEYIVQNHIMGMKIYQIKGPIEFSGVKADDITDNLTIKLVSINNIRTETATQNGYIRVNVK